MSLSIEAKVGKKHTVYLPEMFVERLRIKEGEEITIKLEGSKIILETIKDPLELALKGKKFAKIKEEDVEKISLKEQERYGSSAFY